MRWRPYEDIFPVLTGEVLVCRFYDDIVKDVGLRAKHGVCLFADFSRLRVVLRIRFAQGRTA